MFWVAVAVAEEDEDRREEKGLHAASESERLDLAALFNRTCKQAMVD
jgi:hypothetical protein